jgi:hypothetical protein
MLVSSRKSPLPFIDLLASLFDDAFHFVGLVLG